MNNRIIIENRSSGTDLDCMDLVRAVMKKGKISNGGKQYCYYSSIAYGGRRYGVAANLNKRSDRFVVLDHE